MVKFGVVSDTHITSNDDPDKIQILLQQINSIFDDMDEIIHAGNIYSKSFLNELEKIAPTTAIKGNLDYIENLQSFVKISAGKYNIGVIHELPDHIEDFFKENNLHILIHGHTHIPLIQGTKFNALLLNPGSPTKPKAPPKKPLFREPIARPTVITLEIDENDILKTFIVNLRYKIQF
ncbi:MAG: metallophosphoesterase [Promethearchaeota archaeon]|nr:MAG: metallophosphoesterase [Candidatus Lokiarchaeota archaeon]